MKKYTFVALLAFGISFALCLALIPILRKIKAGQNVLSYVKEHKKKSGTPTFGGLAFLPAAVLACMPVLRELNRSFWVACVIGLSYMAVGFAPEAISREAATRRFAVIYFFGEVFICSKNR